jgi:hypothetical protein
MRYTLEAIDATTPEPPFCSFHLHDSEGEYIDTGSWQFYVTEDNAVDDQGPLERLYTDLYGLHQCSEIFDPRDTITVRWDGDEYLFRVKGVHVTGPTKL